MSADDPQQKPTSSDDKTLPSRPEGLDAELAGREEGEDDADSTPPQASPTIPRHPAEMKGESGEPAENQAQASDPDTTSPTESSEEEQTPRRIEKTVLPADNSIVESTAATPEAPPWTLQQFFNGEIDLDVELAKRFPSMPVMSTIKFRGLGTQTGRGVATLATQDGGASVVVDADAASKVIQLSFTFGSMLTLRFTMDNLTDMDRSRWLELMRREQGGMAFLWGAERWEHDYILCISRRYYTNMYAFSPHNFEAAIRLTPHVMKKLLDWLESFWDNRDHKDDEPPQLLTW